MPSPERSTTPRVHPRASVTLGHPGATLHAEDLTALEPYTVRSLQFRARSSKQQSAEILACRYTIPSSPTLKTYNAPTLKWAVIYDDRYSCTPPQPITEVIRPLRRIQHVQIVSLPQSIISSSTPTPTSGIYRPSSPRRRRSFPNPQNTHLTILSGSYHVPVPQLSSVWYFLSPH